MLTLNEYRQILGEESKKYTDQQLRSMLEFQSTLAQIIVEQLKREEDEKTSRIDEPRIK